MNDLVYDEADAMNLWMSLPKLEWRHKAMSSHWHEDKEYEHVYRLVQIKSSQEYFNLQRYTASSCKRTSFPWFIDAKKHAIVLFYGVVEPTETPGRNYTRWFENEPLCFLDDKMDRPFAHIKENTNGSVTDINEPLVAAFLRKSGFPN